MPVTKVVLYQEDDGTVPLRDWLAGLQVKPRAKCLVRIEELEKHGHELTRPEADYLRDGIYELRARFQSVNYRVLYFFHGREAVVLSHGLTKEDRVAPREIDLAIQRKAKFQQDPDRHTYEEAEGEEGEDE